MAFKYRMKENENLSDRLVLALEADGKTREVSAQFAAVYDIVGKVDFATELLKKYRLLPKFIRDCKSNARSEELRLEGNKLYSAGFNEDALERYTSSIVMAEPGSEPLALAYANRSAICFRIGLYDECLVDIQRALMFQYPTDLKPKLLQRQREARHLIHRKMFNPYFQLVPTILRESKHSNIECASNFVEVRHDPIAGRHIVASRDIQIGEIIAVELAAFSVLTDESWCHCHHCLVLCYSLIPCDFCTQALFCSVKCCTAARDYHDYECLLLGTLYTLDSNKNRTLALRIAIILRNRYMNLFGNQLQYQNGYQSGRYLEIHNLVTNEHLRTNSNIFDRAISTSIFYHLVKFTNFFDTLHPETVNIFKYLVFHNLLTMGCNFHAIDNLEWNPHSKIYASRSIGSGAFSFLSLFNHSCAPNIERISYSRYIVVVALEHIRKGEQLYDNYGYHFATQNKSERQEALKRQYFFDCRCRACVNDWPKFDSLPRLHPQRNCFTDNYYSLARADLVRAIKIEPMVRQAALELQHQIPSKDYCEIQELLKQCHCVHGNIRRGF